MKSGCHWLDQVGLDWRNLKLILPEMKRESAQKQMESGESEEVEMEEGRRRTDKHFPERLKQKI
jgi:hypothetical protein